MSKRFRGPRNEASRRDIIAQHEIIRGAPKNIQARNDTIASAPFNSGGATAALTGSAVVNGAVESAIISGGQTIIITLTGAVWDATIGADNAITDALIANITSTSGEAAGWTAQIIGGDGSLDFNDVVRTSDTIVTITLPASASYSLVAEESVTVVVPGSCVQKGITPVIASPTFYLSPVVITLSGTAIAGGVLESEIVAGGETIIMTMSGSTWPTDIAVAGSPFNNLFGNFNGDDTGADGFDIRVRPLITPSEVTRTSDTVVTLILPAAAAYSITTDGDEDVQIPFNITAIGGNVVADPVSFTITEGS
jgi:hypothetical protein